MPDADCGYLRGVEIIKTWTHDNVSIALPASEQHPLRHLLLIGPNGSGKTTVLETLAKVVHGYRSFRAHERNFNAEVAKLDASLEGTSAKVRNHLEVLKAQAVKKRADWRASFGVFPVFGGEGVDQSAGEPISVHVEALSTFQGAPVSGPAAQDLKRLWSMRKLQQASFVQYLVNQRTEQAYLREEGKEDEAKRLADWFDRLAKDLSSLLGGTFTLEFERQPNFAFYLVDAKGRRSPFETLPSGWNAILNVMSRLILGYAAHGESPATSTRPAILFIDEPEVHLHPALQWTILPTLTRIFPRLQIVGATQSPIVAASLIGAVVYDLAGQTELEPLYGGAPNSVLLRAFGALARPSRVEELLRSVESKIDSDTRIEAEDTLVQLANLIGSDDPDVVRLQALLEVLRSNDGAPD